MNNYNLTENHFKLLRKIYLLKMRSPLTRTELAEKMNLQSTNPHFQYVIKFCIENGLIKESYTYKVVRILEINNNKIERFIRNNSSEFKKWGKFIEKSKPYNYNY